jgi:hypothetical protein
MPLIAPHVMKFHNFLLRDKFQTISDWLPSCCSPPGRDIKDHGNL